MIETDLCRVLETSLPVLALVQSRIYPMILPKNPKMPAVTYQVIASVSTAMFDTAGMQRIRVQINCWDDTYLGAVTLRDAVAKSLDGYKDSNFNALLLNKTDYFVQDALQYRALIEFYLFTTQF